MISLDLELFILPIELSRKLDFDETLRNEFNAFTTTIHPPAHAQTHTETDAEKGRGTEITIETGIEGVQPTK